LLKSLDRRANGAFFGSIVAMPPCVQLSPRLR
jgi:hypothetical protein